MNRTFISNSVEETEAIAADFAQSLVGGECITLEGELGSGKTQFVRGLVRGLGGPSRAVSSPTFVLLNVYNGGRLTVYHLDAYRVSGSDDFEAIGFRELSNAKSVVLVEWASRVLDEIPYERIAVEIIQLSPSRRKIRFFTNNC